jgi:hypothetical protein
MAQRLVPLRLGPEVVLEPLFLHPLLLGLSSVLSGIPWFETICYLGLCGK